ncbi:hypothetical protein RHGRI_034647 [Rhododendron griersonianum]|uniref:PB1-like domain-containing protein n=1 Tax=Rhododendron griersonianum TaxID=479676 RepID=A0AAV6I4A1_9ERIC|nr:hypothetical protein RHGRI_034647 [Rhododendron griersonianum]
MLPPPPSPKSGKQTPVAAPKNGPTSPLQVAPLEPATTNIEERPEGIRGVTALQLLIPLIFFGLRRRNFECSKENGQKLVKGNVDIEEGTMSDQDHVNAKMETLDLRCTLLARVGGKLIRGAHWEYKDGVTAEIKVDPDSYTFYEFMDVIKEIGYTVQEDNISVYYTLPPDINNGLVALRNHDDMFDMFATHLLNGIKYFSIDIYVDCPNVIDSEDEELIGGVNQGCITKLRGDQQVGEGQRGGDQYGKIGVGEGQGGGDQDGEVGEGEG